MTLTELWTHLLGSLAITTVLFVTTFPYQDRWSWFIRAVCITFWLGDLWTIHEIWTRSRKSRDGGA